MSLITLIYLVSLLGTLKAFSGCIVLFSFILILVFFILGRNVFVVFGLKISITPKIIKYYLISVGVFLFLFLIIPKERLMHAMIAVEIDDDVYRSETAKKGIELLDLRLNQLIKETKEQANK